MCLRNFTKIKQRKEKVMGKEICDACTRPVGGDNTRMVGQNWLCPP